MQFPFCQLLLVLRREVRGKDVDKVKECKVKSCFEEYSFRDELERLKRVD